MSKQRTKKTEDIKQKCLNCNNHTNHAVLARKDKTDGNQDVTLWTSYMIIQCKGCDSIYFRKESQFSEEIDYDDNGNPYMPTTIECYPKPQMRIDGLYLGDDVWSIPKIVQTIYQETLSAVEHDLPMLAGVGIRTVLEAVCRELKAKKRNLEDKIEELVGLSVLTPAGATILHGIRLLGNEAAHETKAPTMKQIVAALKVTDHLLLGVYVLPQEAAILPKQKPGVAKVNQAVAKPAGGGTP